MSDSFAARLLAWHARHGRGDLPWQQPPTPYRVWVSEIMLQQTRVNTVIPYFQRFMQRFPELSDLAEAPLDAVLHAWTGLGYYARARNLHRAARQVCAVHRGRLPDSLAALTALPGIGRSTAGAILALAFGQRQAILDGNVKRVLCRYHALPGWPGEKAVEQRLWALAETHTPRQRVAAYTQAIMDLGATVCTRAAPACPACPQQAECLARRDGRVADYPAPRPRKPLPVRATAFLMLRREDGRVLLQQRPRRGLWGGLWSFPECAAPREVPAWCAREVGPRSPEWRAWPAFRHTFTHFHLDITPVRIALPADCGPLPLENRAGANTLWYDLAQPAACGLAAPVARLIDRLTEPTIIGEPA